MVVEKLNIVVLDNWSWLGSENEYAKELNGGGQALAERYRVRMGDTKDSQGLVRVLTLKSAMGSDYAYEALKDKGHSGGNSGTYVIGHTPGFSGDTLGGLDPKGLATVLKELAVVPVRKLCLMGCSSGYGDRDHGHKGDPTYLAELCKALAIPNLLVAAWRHFVTIDGEGHKLIKVPYNSKTAETVRPTATTRKSQKVAYQWKSDSAGVVGLDAWSDKARFVYALADGNMTVLPANWNDKGTY